MRLKIGITCYPTVGGSGVLATELGMALAEKGHQVHFITSGIPYRLENDRENIFLHEVEVNQYAVFKHPPYDLALASKMADVIQREKLDIIHVHYAIPHSISAFLAREMAEHPVKVVTTLHGTDITVLGADPGLSNMIRFGIERSDAVTAVSKHLSEETSVVLQTKQKIETIYNFVDENEYYPIRSEGLKERLKIRPEQKVLIHVSNFRKVKRIEDTVRVHSEVVKRVDAVLLLIGEGPEIPRIRELVHELKLNDSVRFVGNQKCVAKYINISDLAILLSEKESFGLVLIEAMACGVPTLGSNAGGIPEVIEDGITGCVRSLGNIKEFAEAAIRILDDTALHSEMSKNALSRVHEHFSKEKIVAQYEALYLHTLSIGNDDLEN